MVGPMSSHWDLVYDVDPTTKKWHQDVPSTSLELLRKAGIKPDGSIVDVGAGASRFAETLVELGYQDVTVLDVSDRGLSYARERLGDRADAVTWVVADVRNHRFNHTFNLWHDRAVFHFLADEADRERYMETLQRALKPGGYAIIASFGPQAPEYCSGLPVVRYDRQQLVDAFGPGFMVVEATEQMHRTPGGELQPFTWVLLQKTVDLP